MRQKFIFLNLNIGDLLAAWLFTVTNTCIFRMERMKKDEKQEKSHSGSYYALKTTTNNLGFLLDFALFTKK